MAKNILVGLQAAYDALATKDAGTLYLVTDTPAIYLGATKLANLTGDGGGGNPLKDIAFDTTTQTFTFTYEDNSTKTVDLVLESVLQSVTYDKTTHKMTLTVVGGSTTEIDLTDLVDAYTVANTDTISLTLAAGQITAAVNISATAGNQLTANADGLYVPEPDMSFGTF
jgi:hypothetical protein